MSGSDEFAEFLRRTLPSLGLDWRRHHRRGVRRRIVARMDGLRLRSFEAYHSLVLGSPEEGRVLRALLPVTITRLFRNRPILEGFAALVFPRTEALAAGGEARAWSAGCAGGEEPITLAILWRRWSEGRRGARRLRVLATDVDERCLERGRTAVYGESSMREVPAEDRTRFFERADGRLRVRPEILAGIEFRRHDLREDPPPARMHLVLCRNAAFTYFDDDACLAAAQSLRASLVEGGHLLVGRRERVAAADRAGFGPIPEVPGLYRALPVEATRRR